MAAQSELTNNGRSQFVFEQMSDFLRKVGVKGAYEKLWAELEIVDGALQRPDMRRKQPCLH